MSPHLLNNLLKVVAIGTLTALDIFPCGKIHHSFPLFVIIALHISLGNFLQIGFVYHSTGDKQNDNFLLSISNLPSPLLSPLPLKFALLGQDTFYHCLLQPGVSSWDTLVNVLCMFETTYLCEQTLSVRNINKTKLNSRLTHNQLAATQALTPSIDALVLNCKFFIQNAALKAFLVLKVF